MICGFAFLLWSIDKSMPVYADAVESSIYCEGTVLEDGDCLAFNAEKSCLEPATCTAADTVVTHNDFVYTDSITATSALAIYSLDDCQNDLKEAEEALASCQAYVDSLNWVTIPEGWKVESVEGEWSEENK